MPESKRMKMFDGDTCPDCGKPANAVVCCKIEAKRINEERLSRLQVIIGRKIVVR